MNMTACMSVLGQQYSQKNIRENVSDGPASSLLRRVMTRGEAGLLPRTRPAATFLVNIFRTITVSFTTVSLILLLLLLSFHTALLFFLLHILLLLVAPLPPHLPPLPTVTFLNLAPFVLMIDYRHILCLRHTAGASPGG